MILSKDFQEFIELLNKHGVEYMVVGGYALAFHGKPRHTGDMDIWIHNTEANAERVMRVVQDFGLGSLGLRKDDFVKEGAVTQIGYPPLRIDILNSIDGVDFKEANSKRQFAETEKGRIPFIGVEDFIKNKKAVARPQDLADIEKMQKGKRIRR
jgi:hypothetical protein